MSFTTDEIEDLKQLFAANNYTLMAEFRQILDDELEIKLEQKLQPIRQDIRDLTEFVQNAISDSNDANQDQLDDHERRIAKLETRHA